ncbi:uncharacterized protein OCT59_009803 [Rhizophagus irregularis]|uniref:uncharacterized protein n=1 Tax=Rhizophagus irregularis TaxID=588596 RepID=UPI00332CBAE0|nr:hypothetical protein OCT59_009803 [Rhizophagus irregularis]
MSSNNRYSFINSKSTHANHLYQLWQFRYSQKIFSNRLGIERFTANGTNFVQTHPTANNPSQPTEVLAQFLSPSEIAALGRFLESLPKSFPFVRGHNPVDTTRLGWNYYLQYNPDLPHLPPNICIRSPDDDAVDASFANNNGTSLKHFHRRSATTSQLTTYNNSFHEHMKWASQPTPNNKSRKWKRL